MARQDPDCMGSRRNSPIPPYVPELYELAERDFKLTFDAPGANQGSLLQHGFERIVHHLRGIQIGLALGGGAARGMAHLGVLKALEQHGIYVDMLAGTSAGAMTGTFYAAGLDPEYIVRTFKTDLQPSWFFRQLPGGGYWYLLYKYRRNQFDSMLRKYLGRARMEQLILPMFAISVDLVEGGPLVREVGDATISVLESINLPPLSLPIIRVRPSVGGRRVAQQYSGQRAGSQGMQLCHRIDRDSKARERLCRNPLQGASAQKSFLLNNTSDHATEHDSGLQHELRWSTTGRLCDRARRDLL